MRMRADVSWGVELSGGLDSSSIVAFASQLSEVPIKTYTVRYPEQELNETSYAYSVSKYYGTDHHVVEPSVQNLWHEIRAFTALEEEPTHAPNIYTRQLIGRRWPENGPRG
jgi:asparagine synthase (glutamine-hydrolysing)